MMLRLSLSLSLALATPAFADSFSFPPISAPSSTTAGLPACSAATSGFLYQATDALTPVALSILAGGGAVKVLVICNGTNWIVG